MYERLPETIRVSLGDDLPDHYVLVIPSKTDSMPYREFYLVNDRTGRTKFMFGCSVKTDDEAAEMAIANAPLYIPYEETTAGE